MKKALLLNLVIIILQVSLSAQENNYWNIQLGTRSESIIVVVMGSD